VRESERNARFRGRAEKAAKRVAAFKKKFGLKRGTAAPSADKISRLSTQLWEFSEQIRLRKIMSGAGE